MIERDIHILALQETHMGQNTRESHEQFTCFLSGESWKEGYVAGVGFVIRNDYLKYVLDVEPVTDRLCTMTLNYVTPITLVCTYIPQAMRPAEEKEQTYKHLARHYKLHKNEGPTYILGDMNARVQKRLNRSESTVIGEHTFEPHSADPMGRSDQVIENRQMLIDFCMDHQLILANTLFKKNKHKLVTYREIGTTIEDEVRRGTHEQIDFIIVASKWKNNIKNAESDTDANIDSDHYPVIVEIRVKLKAIHVARRNRPKYDICTETQRQHVNRRLRETLEETMSAGRFLERLQMVAEEALPKLPKKEKQIPFSERTELILEQREATVAMGDAREFVSLTNSFLEEQATG